MPPPDRVASGRGARADDLPAEACGLSQAEVAERRRLGQVNDVPATSTHSVPQILRANILTPFNALLGGLLAVILVVGPLQDALFGLVLIANSLTGIVQELRAKRALDHLTVVNAPKARVVRGGSIIEVPLAEVVLDDLLEVRSGDQVVVDAIVAESRGLLVPPFTRFFAVEMPPPMVAGMIAVVVAVTYPLMHLSRDLVARRVEARRVRSVEAGRTT